MANINAPFGFRPVRMLNGSPWNGQTIRCYLHADYAQAMYIGDPVMFQTELDYKDTTGCYPSIMLATGATATIIRGVITSFEPLPNSITKQYNPASTERWCQVSIGKDVVYQIRDDGSATPDKSFPGANAVCTAAAGDTFTGLSKYSMSCTIADTQAHSIHILGLADTPENELGTYAVWDVLLNTCENAAGRFLGIIAA